ncbi:MAG: SDR family oxidoreductase [Acidobacterium ailaaui]|nr:SDR family oxidoreductase [Pseudacidobacterium ailaaui]
MRLKNKVAVVTGGSRDIGREVSIRLASEGAKVVINYFNEPDLAEETLDLVKKVNGEAILVQGDMTKLDDVKRLAFKAREAFGDQIHVLVNVAGGLIGRKLIEEMDLDFWNSVISVNLTSVYMVCREIVPFMPSGSSIINFSSQAARDGGGYGASAYVAAKGGVTSYTRALAKELGPKNIRVNAVCPGMIATRFHDIFTKPEVREKVAQSTPLRREGMAREVADLVLYLASDESSFITGANIDINGGLYFS